MSHTHLQKLDRVQNEAVRVIQWTTKDTTIETMQISHRCKWDKKWNGSKHTLVQCNCHNPLHKDLQNTKGSRLAQGKSWMGQVEAQVNPSIMLADGTRANQAMGNRVRHLWDPPARKLGKTLLKMASRHGGRRSSLWLRSTLHRIS